jgi:hypothetical protein
MGKFNYIQNNFAAGELSDKLDGRTDLPQYRAGAKVLENCFTLRQGGVTRRPGTRFIVETLGTSRLFPFVFSKNDAAVVMIDTSQLLAIDRIKIYNPSNDTTLTLFQDVGAAIPLNLDMDKLQFVQSGDVMFFVHPDILPFVIYRDANGAYNRVPHWLVAADPSGQFLPASIKNDALSQPFRDQNKTTITIDPAAATGATTCTASAPLWDANHIGSYWRYTDEVAGEEGIFIITAPFIDSQNVNIFWKVEPSGHTATTKWSEGSWSDYRGYPQSITIHESRLIFGGNLSQPDTIWASMQYNYFHMMKLRLLQDEGLTTDPSGVGYDGDAQASDPFQFTIASKEANQIQWMESGRFLQLGTVGTEYTIRGGEEASLNSTNIQVVPQTTYGSAPVQAQRVGHSTLYLSRDGKRLREMEYQVQSDSFIAPNLSLLASDIIKHGFDPASSVGEIQIKEIVYQEARGILWALTSQDALIGLSIDKDANVLAWHKHTIGGQNVEIKSITTIPNPEGTFDDLYLLVKRDIDDPGFPTQYYLEKIGGDFEHPLLFNTSSYEDDKPYFLDCSKRVSAGDTSYYSDIEDLIVTWITPNNFLDLTGISINYIDGQAIRFYDYGSGVLPGGLVYNKTYYVQVVSFIVGFSTKIKLHNTRADALAQINEIELTSVHSGTIRTSHARTQFPGNIGSPLDHLNYETVTVLADGFVSGEYTITLTGILTINEEAFEVIVGYPYTTTIETMRLEAGLQLESSQGQAKRIDRVTARFYRTWGAKIGDPSRSDSVEIKFREISDGFGSRLELFSGDKQIKFTGGPDREARVKITQDYPLPMTVTGLIMRGVNYE